MKINPNSEYAILIDGGYITHVVMFSAFAKWLKQDGRYEINASDLNENLKLTQFPSFLEQLENSFYFCFRNLEENLFQKRLRDYKVENFPKFFINECRTKDNWRAAVLPEYKAQRKLTPKKFNSKDVFGYIENFLQSSIIKEKFNLHFFQYKYNEADDVIAILCNYVFKKQKRILISTDNDFVQLGEGIHQFDIRGEPIARDKLYPGKEFTTEQFKLLKILIGDKGDNIMNVKKGWGVQSCIELVEDNNKLVEFLKDKQCFENFKRNSTLIDFNNIPKENIIGVLEEYKKFVSDREIL